MKASVLFVVVVPAARRDEVVDLLMTIREVSGFTRASVAGFGREHSHLSLRESVQGYTDQERFEVVCEPSVVEVVLAALRTIAGRDRFFYWEMPLSRYGLLEPVEGLT